MRILVSVLFPILCLAVTVSGHNGHFAAWSYQDQDNWPEQCQKGSHQSPVALEKNSAVLKDFTPLVLTGYDEKGFVIVKNNGHSAEVRLGNTVTRPTLAGAQLPEHYKFDHLHFHWQSEHIIDGYRYPLEMHAVHYATAYGNLENASKYENGIAVLAVLYYTSPDDDKDFEPLIQLLDTLEMPGVSHTLEDFRLIDYFPRDKAGFFRYNGSLTTPQCNEAVVWTVFTSLVPISSRQVDKFHALHSDGGNQLTNNYRDLQPLNDRYVYRKASPVENGASTIQAFYTFTSLALAVLFYSIF